MKRIILFGFLISALCILTACHRVPAFVQNPTMNNLSGAEQKLLTDIEGSGIQVIRQGMSFTFILPTDCFFHHTTHDLYSSREKDLDRLAQFLDYYSHYFASPRITIAGHTDNTWISPNSNLLALHYAETIAAYFQEDGIDPNIILVEGQGSKNTIASNQDPMGASFNRRVVVTFAYGPALAVVQAQERAARLAALQKARLQAKLEAEHQAWLKAQLEAQRKAQLKAQEQQMAQLKAQQEAQQKAQRRLEAAKKALAEKQQQQKDRLENEKGDMTWGNANRCYGAACNAVPSLPTTAKHAAPHVQKKLRKQTHSVNVNTTKTQKLAKPKHSTMGWDDVNQCYGAACT